MITIGVDPGLHGAIAVYDAAASAIVEILDMPVTPVLVSKKERMVLDVPQLHHEIGRLRKQFGPALAVLEEVGAMPKDGAVSAFKFGWVVGVIYGAFSGYRFRIERVRPQIWKKALKVPAIKAASVARADELFPSHRNLWRGARGGALADRAEAAMLAKYGAETYVTRS